MILVIDTSAGAEIVLQRGRAVEFAEHVEAAEWVQAPTLYVAETANVFWKYHTFGDMPVESCERAMEHAVSIPDEFLEEKDLFKEAFALACLTRRPVYDMFFLVAARRNNAALLTADGMLRDTARKNSIRVV